MTTRLWPRGGRSRLLTAWLELGMATGRHQPTGHAALSRRFDCQGVGNKISSGAIPMKGVPKRLRLGNRE